MVSKGALVDFMGLLIIKVFFCCVYFMAIGCNCFMSFFISFGGILRCVSAYIDCSCKIRP